MWTSVSRIVFQGFWRGNDNQDGQWLQELQNTLLCPWCLLALRTVSHNAVEEMDRSLLWPANSNCLWNLLLTIPAQISHSHSSEGYRRAPGSVASS